MRVVLCGVGWYWLLLLRPTQGHKVFMPFGVPGEKTCLTCMCTLSSLTLWNFLLPNIFWSPLALLCLLLACTETLCLSWRTLPPSQLFRAVSWASTMYCFHSPAKSCMSYLKLNFSKTFIYELHYILLKTSGKPWKEGHCYHVTEGVSHSLRPGRSCVLLLLSMVSFQNCCADLHKASVQFKWTCFSWNQWQIVATLVLKSIKQSQSILGFTVYESPWRHYRSTYQFLLCINFIEVSQVKIYVEVKWVGIHKDK